MNDQSPIKNTEDATANPPVAFSCDTSRGFYSWLKSQHASLVISTYQVGKLIFLGTDPEGKLWIHNRNVGRCLGLAATGSGPQSGLWVSSDSQLYHFGNMMGAAQQAKGGEDACYAPRLSFFTGDLDVHDVGITQSGPVFVNTLMNCLARPSQTASFEPIWQPPFITRLAAEDRCHLNGLAIKEGKPKYVTMVAQTDTFDGWRDHRQSGGVVMDVELNEVVCRGLSMPHSPRWHEGELYVHNSGRGEFGRVNLDSGTFESIAFCPGYLRGMAFMSDVAVVGLSLPRGNKTFSGLELDEALGERQVNPKCGLYFIDLASGDVIHQVIFGGLVTELYDVAVLSQVRQPSAISPLSDEVKRAIKLAG